MWKKVFVIVAIVIVCLGFLIGIRYLLTSYNERAESLIQNNGDDLQIIADYLMSIDCDAIHIESADETMLLMLRSSDSIYATIEKEYVSISAEEVNRAIKTVMGKGCNTINKNGDTIEFLMWTKFTDFGAGLVYYTGSDGTPNIQFLTKLEQLPREGWYYYEEDYNDWRSKNS